MPARKSETLRDLLDRLPSSVTNRAAWADAIGLDEKTIRRLLAGEVGERGPRRETVRRLCDGLAPHIRGLTPDRVRAAIMAGAAEMQ